MLQFTIGARQLFLKREDAPRGGSAPFAFGLNFAIQVFKPLGAVGLKFLEPPQAVGVVFHFGLQCRQAQFDVHFFLLEGFHLARDGSERLGCRGHLMLCFFDIAGGFAQNGVVAFDFLADFAFFALQAVLFQLNDFMVALGRF